MHSFHNFCFAELVTFMMALQQFGQSNFGGNSFFTKHTRLKPESTPFFNITSQKWSHHVVFCWISADILLNMTSPCLAMQMTLNSLLPALQRFKNLCRSGHAVLSCAIWVMCNMCGLWFSLISTFVYTWIVVCFYCFLGIDFYCKDS